MEADTPTHYNLWDEITEPLCTTIAEDTVCYDPLWLALAFFKNIEEDIPMLMQPSLEQAAEDEEYAKRFQTEPASQSHPEATKLTAESSEDFAVESFIEVDVNGLKFNHGSCQLPEYPQPFAHDSQTAMTSSFTPAVEPSTIDFTSSTITAGVSLEAPRSNTGDYLSGCSPTPNTTTPLEAGDQTPSPNTPTTNINAKSHKRRLSFGVLVPECEDEVSKPPPKLRRLAPTLKDHIYSHYMHEESTTPTDVEVMFRNIPSIPITHILNDTEAPKTPMFYGSGCPPSPIVIGGNYKESYPKCCNGIFEEIPLHYLRSLRKAVDPAFQNEQWGDGLYFLNAPTYNQYYDQSEAYGFQRLDWRIIFHALNHAADRRIPLPDTNTPPLCNDEQVYKIWMSFRGLDLAKAISQAEMPREWVEAQTTKALCRWTQVRGTYYQDPPEFNFVQSNDICADLDFSSFCEFARFVEGRPAVMSNGLALGNPLNVLRYARLQPVRAIPQNNGLDPQQMMTLSQYPIPGNATLLRNSATPFGNSDISNPSVSLASTTPQDLRQTLFPPFQQTQQIDAPLQNTTPIEHSAFNNINVFKNLPRQHLMGFQLQWLRTRAQRYASLGQLAPNTPPTVLHLWHYFRHVVQMKKQRAAREETDASILRHPPTGQPETPVSSRPLQLEAHMPATPGPSGRMVGGVNVLASPFETPGRVRNHSVDPGLT